MLRMSGAPPTDKPNPIQEHGGVEFDHDAACAKLLFYFVTNLADRAESNSQRVQPSFVHQIYDDQDKLALLRDISRIEITIDCTSWISHIVVYSGDGNQLGESGTLLAIIRPIVEKLSPGKG